ncbi:germ cell nuclear acidic protein isoform X1 [Synchiropus splendidus]|uniref:germ cell nuclear acidic protein isoform X1 n=1 Tax=Synchiropus splendidus TaxID=270530 RepID=UPI00237DCA01|nr:germ cell nuclear acidic protein isoform X1 [Synchiropus splendidus]
MNKETSDLFERVAKKMGWTDDDALVSSEKKLMTTIGKSRHAATSGGSLNGLSSLLERDDAQDKENRFSGGVLSRHAAETDSSDDDFDQFLTEKATPKSSTKKPCSAAKKTGPVIHVVSSDDDDDDGFEKFLQKVKTPVSKWRKQSGSGSDDSLKNFIVGDALSDDDDFVMPKSSTKVPKKIHTPSSQPTFRKPLAQFHSPVFVSDSDDDDAIVVKSTWRTRHSKPKCATETSRSQVPSFEETETPSPLLPPLSSFSFPTDNTPNTSRRPGSAPTKLDESSSSEDEFSSLLERLKKKKNALPSASCSPNIFKAPPPKAVVTSDLLPRPQTSDVRSTSVKPLSQSEPRNPSSSRLTCKTPGCFLQALSDPGSSFQRSFKQKREDLTAKLYQLYNTSVFDSKVWRRALCHRRVDSFLFPTSRSFLPTCPSRGTRRCVKQQATASQGRSEGAADDTPASSSPKKCVTRLRRHMNERKEGRQPVRWMVDMMKIGVARERSSDRLRDTLIHEMCHAATWLINGVRDGHGNFWKLYARKSTLAHPELPMVTRCHSYDIKYKFQYQCVRCQNTIGRHSKSLDTQKFACALCMGQLVLLTPSKPRAPTPFANFVKENYGTTRQEMAGQSHAEVMRKLSADFATKTRLSQS